MAEYSGLVSQASTLPRYGSTVAVASMTNAQLATYYWSDTSLGSVANVGYANGLKDKLADGRAGGFQDFADANYIKQKLFSQN
jgi:hypothetical protein